MKTSATNSGKRNKHSVSVAIKTKNMHTKIFFKAALIELNSDAQRA